jgi:hypothetical protein
MFNNKTLRGILIKNTNFGIKISSKGVENEKYYDHNFCSVPNTLKQNQTK